MENPFLVGPSFYNPNKYGQLLTFLLTISVLRQFFRTLNSLTGQLKKKEEVYLG